MMHFILTIFAALDILSLVATEQKPVYVSQLTPEVTVCDFGKDAFCRVSFGFAAADSCVAVIRLGERLQDGRVDRTPPGSVRYAEYTLDLVPGCTEYPLELRRDPRNTKSLGKPGNEPPVIMPEYIGEVYPFRYVEVEAPAGTFKGVIRDMVHYPFDDEASFFHCSDTVLNKVWDLCKYSIKATSFCGIYVDGDRERIPYEADALINQLCHYGVDSQYGMARASLEYLTDHATWPTEWLLQMPLMAWNDYMYTGDASFLESRYDDMVAKALIPLRDSHGLISTTSGVTREIEDAVHFKHGSGIIKDIVDWPHKGSFGPLGEDDYYEYTEHNTVVNAFHAKALDCLSRMAAVLGKNEDAVRFRNMSDLTAESLYRLCFDTERGAFRDGVESDHTALHASLFPLAFGLVPAGDVPAVLRFIEGRGLACSVYAAHYLLEGLFDAGDSEYAVSLMSSMDGRSWYNMLREGATITMEAWGQKFKPNQDWNHAWGAAPASAIPRKLMGIEPAVPGGSELWFRPRPGGLEWAEALVPTPSGGVACSFRRLRNGKYRYYMEVPDGVKVYVELPGSGKIRVRGAGRHRITGSGKP